MLKKELVILKLREIAINFSLEIKEEYLEFIFKKLNEYNISEKRFILYANRILLKETTLFNKMPPLAMFINPNLTDSEKIMEEIENKKEERRLLENEKSI